jgi:hypothetical protein
MDWVVIRPRVHRERPAMLKTIILIASAITMAIAANAVMFMCVFAGYQIAKLIF